MDSVTVRRIRKQAARVRKARSVRKLASSVTKSERRRHHNWRVNQDHRLLLFYLSQLYHNRWRDVSKLFNHIFFDEIEEYFPDGLSARTIGAQYWECIRRNSPVVSAIRKMSRSEVKHAYSRFQVGVEEAASALNIRMIPRTGAEDWPNAVDDTWSRNDNNDDSDDLDVIRMPPARTSSAFTLSAAVAPALLPALPITPSRPKPTQLLTPPSSSHSRLKSSDPLEGLPARDGVPFILMRAWTKASHGMNSFQAFYAGRQVNTTGPPESDEDFQNYAKDHLWYAKNPSPLVSLTPSFLSVLKKAMSMSSLTACPMITLIDGRALASSTRVYHALETVRNLRRKGVKVPPRYWGRFEFWAWQKVRGVIGTTTLQDFKNWVESDSYLGKLLCADGLSSMSVASFRERCAMSDLTVCPALAHSIGTLFKLFKATIFVEDAQLKDFVRVMLQNFHVTDDLDAWLRDESFVGALADSLAGGLAPVPEQPISLSRAALTQSPQRFQIVQNQQASLMDESGFDDDDLWASDTDEDSPLAHAARSVDSDWERRLADLDEEDDDDTISACSDDNLEHETMDARPGTSNVRQTAAELLQRFMRPATRETPSSVRDRVKRRIITSSEDSSWSEHNFSAGSGSPRDSVEPVDMDEVEARFPQLPVDLRRQKRTVSPDVVNKVHFMTTAGSPMSQKLASRFLAGIKARTIITPAMKARVTGEKFVGVVIDLCD